MSRERRKQEMRERVRETFGPAGEPLPPSDRTGRILEAIVAFALGTGFWRLLLSDSWGVSVAFGLLLAALLFSYGLFRERMAEKAAEDDDRPRRGPGR